MARIWGYVEANDDDILEAAAEIDAKGRERAEYEAGRWRAEWERRKARLEEDIAALKAERKRLKDEVFNLRREAKNGGD